MFSETSNTATQAAPAPNDTRGNTTDNQRNNNLGVTVNKNQRGGATDSPGNVDSTEGSIRNQVTVRANRNNRGDSTETATDVTRAPRLVRKKRQQVSRVYKNTMTWWRHQMETFSVSLALCAGNSPVTGEFPAQRPVTRSFDVFLDRRLNRRLSKQSKGWWFETPLCPLWRHSNGTWWWWWIQTHAPHILIHYSTPLLEQKGLYLPPNSKLLHLYVESLDVLPNKNEIFWVGIC